jgi:uncharacterized protein YndB with AHSA1/START domain
MLLAVNTELKIARPIHEVFEAIVEPGHMTQYFITHGEGRMEAGHTVKWTWGDVPGEPSADVQVQTAVPDHLITFTWPSGPVETLVEIHLHEVEDGRTVVRINETGWEKDDEGIARLAENTQGWVGFLCCLKAYLEYGINLRKGSM